MSKVKINDETRSRILSLLSSGRSTADVCRELGVSTKQVAAIKAHRTMGSYARGHNAVRELTTKDLSSPPTDELSSRDSEASAGRNWAAIPLGNDSAMGIPVCWDPHPEAGTANPHLMIVGESGFGKTYAIQCIVAELAARGIRSFIIDFGRGFDLESAPRQFIDSVLPQEVSTSQQGINLNPLQIHPGDSNGPINVAVRVADCFGRVYRIGVQQHALLRDLIIELFADFGIVKAEPGTWHQRSPSCSDLNEKLRSIASSRSDKRAGKAQGLKSHISTFFLFDTFRDSGVDVNWESLGQSTASTLIIQLKGLEDRTQKVVTEFLLWDLYHYLRRRGPHNLDCYCVLDEAHNLSFSSDGPIDKLVREARKFGLGLILASQQPTDFNRTVFGNTASKLIFQTFDHGNRLSRQLASKCLVRTDPEQLAGDIARLQKGEALFFVNNDIAKLKITPLPKRILKIVRN